MIPEEELHDMYWGQGMCLREIGEECGICTKTVLNRMKSYGIESRTLSEARLVNSAKLPKLPKKELVQMYCDEKMSAVEIAKEIGVADVTVGAWMKSYGIKPRTISESMLNGNFIGENAGNWHGGISFEPYCNKFNNTFKEAVRKRDDYTCQLCGCEQLLGGTKLSIHHIHYDKKNCYPDVVTLCRSCNSRVNSNRDHWEDFFETRLIVRGLLNWSIT
jgi:hypothetical protein